MAYADAFGTAPRPSVIGTPVDPCSPATFHAFLDHAVAGSRALRVVTLNPEIAVAGARHARFGAMLRTADLLPVDGIGIAYALRLLGYGRVERLTGTAILPIMCAYAAAHGLRILFLLRAGGLTTPDVLRTTLAATWPTLQVDIATVRPGAPPSAELLRLAHAGAHAFLIMTLGGIEQESWICQYADRFDRARVILGLGGAIDYRCGTVPEPPAFTRRLGLEWCWRLLRQPWRFRRILDAVAVFPALVLLERVRSVRVPYVGLRLRFR